MGLTKGKGGAALRAHTAERAPTNPRKRAKVKRAAQRQGGTSAPVCSEQKAARGVSETPKAPAFEVHARIDAEAVFRAPRPRIRDPRSHTRSLTDLE